MITIRTETADDYRQVAEVITAAFQSDEFSGHEETQLVEKLRKSAAFVPELSLVAVADHQIVGHILLTRAFITHGEQTFPSLSLAPVSVLPEFQRQGIGSQLIKEAHQRAKDLGFTSVIVLGHEEYYPRFGYKPTSQYAIELPFGAPPENCMIVALTNNGLDGVSGKVEYPKEFFS